MADKCEKCGGAGYIIDTSTPMQYRDTCPDCQPDKAVADKCEQLDCVARRPEITANACVYDITARCPQFTTTPTQSITMERLKELERKEKAFDWFIKEMMDEELEFLMKKENYKTPLEAIEKAMMEQENEKI